MSCQASASSGSPVEWVYFLGMEAGISMVPTLLATGPRNQPAHADGMFRGRSPLCLRARDAKADKPWPILEAKGAIRGFWLRHNDALGYVDVLEAEGIEECGYGGLGVFACGVQNAVGEG